jgi:ABC-2 type transport system ATP-binding protein
MDGRAHGTPEELRMIRLEGVTKKFGSFTAVNDISLEVRPGEFYGFLGPNGAGKTTTIKMMTGLFAPTRGRVTIGGHDIERQPLEAKRATGYIPDQPFLYDKLTGREFLFFSGGLYRIPKETLRDTIDELVGHFGLDAWIDKRTEDYSQGMRQRVTIAAALLHNPPVIIIDEPMVGLDPQSAVVIKQTLKQKTREGTTIFMSTHSLPIVEELCDRVGIIKAGRLIFEDTMAALEAFKERHDGKFESVFLELTK